MKRGLETSVFQPVLPIGVTEASASIVIETERKNMRLRVGKSGQTSDIPVSRFNTRIIKQQEDAVHITPLQCNYVLVKGMFVIIHAYFSIYY